MTNMTITNTEVLTAATPAGEDALKFGKPSKKVVVLVKIKKEGNFDVQLIVTTASGERTDDQEFNDFVKDFFKNQKPSIVKVFDL
jgi:hypothetical protein